MNLQELRKTYDNGLVLTEKEYGWLLQYAESVKTIVLSELRRVYHVRAGHNMEGVSDEIVQKVLKLETP
jgi:hypothetical protein